MAGRARRSCDAAVLLFCLSAVAAEDAAASGESVEPLRAQLSNADFNVRLDAAEKLKARGPAAAPAIPDLAKALYDEEGRVREAAAEALGAIGKEAWSELVVAARDPDANVRAAGVKGLGMLGAAGVEELTQSITDKDPFVRQRAAQALACCAGEAAPAVNALALRLADAAEEPWVKADCAVALASVGPDAEPAVPVLLKTLDDPDGWLRSRAIEALGVIRADSDDGALRERFVKALADEDYEVCTEAAESLALLGEGSIGILEQTAADQAHPAQEVAHRALGEMRARLERQKRDLLEYAAAGAAAFVGLILILRWRSRKRRTAS